jgi:hypothetical protein
MFRVISIGGLGAIFLLISPHLRQEVFDIMGVGVSAVELWAPYSYIAGGLLVFVTMVVSFNRGSQAR